MSNIVKPEPTVQQEHTITNVADKQQGRFWHKFSKDSAWREALWDFGISRLALVLITFLAVSRIAASPWPKDGPLLSPYECVYDLGVCAQSWLRWDTEHYLTIAEYGYNHPKLTAFFPLWPMLVGALGRLLGGATVSYYIAALLLANICLYIALVLLYKLVQEEFSLPVAKKTLFLLAFAPYTLFFSVGYAESLFLPLAIATFLLLRRERWWLAGLCGLLAALTRPTALALAVPFLVLLVQRFGLLSFFTLKDIRQKANLIGAMLLIPAGLLTYMIYLYYAFGDPLSFSKWQGIEWNRFTTWPWVGIVYAVQALFQSLYPFEINANNLLFTLLPLMALALGWRRLPLHYSLFALALAIFSLSNPYNLDFPKDTLKAAPRYLLVLFPIYIIFAQWAQHPRVEKVLTVLFLIYFVYNMILFVTNNWVA